MGKQICLSYAPPQVNAGTRLPRRARGVVLAICARATPLVLILATLSLLLYGERFSRQLTGLPFGDNLLLDEALMGNVPGIKHALCEGASPNACGYAGTALMLAVGSDNLAAVDCLLSAGAKINDMRDQGKTALADACWRGNLPMAAYLLDRGADPDEYDNRYGTPLSMAVMNDQPETVRLLLDHGADPNLARDDGTTPLDAAMESPETSQAVRDLLVAAGARRSTRMA